jgi:hypothetical protein
VPRAGARQGDPAGAEADAGRGGLGRRHLLVGPGRRRARVLPVRLCRCRRGGRRRRLRRYTGSARAVAGRRRKEFFLYLASSIVQTRGFHGRAAAGRDSELTRSPVACVWSESPGSQVQVTCGAPRLRTVIRNRKARDGRARPTGGALCSSVTFVTRVSVAAGPSGRALRRHVCRVQSAACCRLVTELGQPVLGVSK